MVCGPVVTEEDTFLNYLFSFICFTHIQVKKKMPRNWNFLDNLRDLPLFMLISDVSTKSCKFSKESPFQSQIKYWTIMRKM